MRQSLGALLIVVAALLPLEAFGQDAEAEIAETTAPSKPLSLAALDIAAADYEAGLDAIAVEESRSDQRLMIDATRAMQREDARAAITALEVMAGRQGGSVAVWMQLAQALAARGTNDTRRLTASYIAYHRARAGDEATRALLELGDAAFARHDFLTEAVRIATDHVKKDENHAAKDELPSLVAEADDMLLTARLIQSEIGRALSRDDELTREGLRLDEKPGFYLLNVTNTVTGGYAGSSNTYENLPHQWHGTVPSATTCVLFSRPVQTDVTAITRAMTLTLIDDGTDTAVDMVPGDVSVAGEQVCLHGLEVDAFYRLGFDNTLRSIGDARLPLDTGDKDDTGGVDKKWASTVFRTLKLKERIGFEGDDYVLRAGGYAKLGAVNMESAELALYRISDRSLARNVALGQFGKGLDSREVTAFDKGIAELVWTGTLDFKVKPNRRALTKIPLDDILEARRRAITDPDASREVFGGTLIVDAEREVNPGTGLFALVVKSAKSASGGGTRQYFVRTENDEAQLERASSLPTQWFVRTNIGLSFYETSEFLHVAARDLRTGAAEGGLHIELISASNRVLESKTTDASGIATFRRAITRGEGALEMRMAMTQSPTDFVFLPADTPPLQLDGLGLARHSIDTQYDLYLTPDRGVYRPGETMQVVALLRDRIGRPVANPPKIVLRVEDDDGPAGNAVTLDATGWQAGGRRIDVKIQDTAAVGAARLVGRLVGEDGKSGKVIGSMRLAVSFFQPDTVRIEAMAKPKLKAEIVGDGDQRTLRVSGGVRASYLYGAPLVERGDLPEAPANGLTGTVRARLVSDGRYEPQTNVGCYGSFRFGNSAQRASSVLRRVETTRATGQDEAPGDGADGKGFLRIAASFDTPPTERAPLKAYVSVQLDDGAATQGRLTPPVPVNVPRTGPMIGMRHVNGQVQSLVLDPADEALETVIYYRIETEDIGYVWQQKDRVWQAEATPRLNTLDLDPDGDLVIKNDRPVVVHLGDRDDFDTDAEYEDSRFDVIGGHEHIPGEANDAGCHVATDMLDVSALPPGRYVVTAALDTGFSGQPDSKSTLATYRFEIGQAEGPRPERPEIFSLRLESKDVKVGGPIVAHVESLSIREGHILVAAVKEGRVLSWQNVPVEAEGDPIRFETDPAKAGAGQDDAPGLKKEDWRGGVHLFATAFRAQGAGRAPNAARAVGASYVTVAGPSRNFEVAVVSPLDTLQTVANDADTVDIRIAAKGLASDEVAYAVVGLVDDGLWRLTEFAPKDPDAHFFAKRSLALDVRDLYGRLLDSSKAGGGGFIPSDGASGLVNGGNLSFLSKPLKFEDGVVDATVDLNGFVGTANLFVIAWSEDGSEARTGFARKSYRFRSNVVMSLIAPERMTPGDTANARLVIHRPVDGQLPDGELMLKTWVGKPGSSSKLSSKPKIRPITLDAERTVFPVTLKAEIVNKSRSAEMPVEVELRFKGESTAIVKKRWVVKVGPPPGEGIDFVVSLGTAEMGKELSIDISDKKGRNGVMLQEVVLNPLAPALSVRTVSYEAPRDFPTAAADAVFSIADLIANRPPMVADGGLGALVALRGDERAVSGRGHEGAAIPALRKLWRTAAALDIALALGKLGRGSDDDIIDIAVGELTGMLRQYDGTRFCEPELYFAAITLARDDSRKSDPSIATKLAGCVDEGTNDAFAAGLLAAALVASGVNGSGEAVDEALALFAATPPRKQRDAAMTAVMILESGVDSDQAAQFVRVATAPSAARPAELDREAAAWMARAHARLAEMFDIDPIDIDALGIDPDDLSAKPQGDGTIRIDLANREIPDRIAFGNGNAMPIHAIGRYSLLPAELTRGGGDLDLTIALKRAVKDGDGYEVVDDMTVRERSFLVLHSDAEYKPGQRFRAIVHVPPGIELAATPYARALAEDMDLMGIVDEVIHRPGRTVIHLRADSNGLIQLAFPVTPIVEGSFTWPAAILNSGGDRTGWSAAFPITVKPQGDAR